jgi:hypothetical protein
VLVTARLSAAPGEQRSRMRSTSEPQRVL